MVTIYPDRGGIGKDAVWPSLATLNSSSYTGGGPGSRAWYMDSGVKREAEYVAGSGWVGLLSTPSLGSVSNPYTAYADLPAPGIPRRRAYMLNPFAPIAAGVDGVVEFVDTGAAWKVVGEQVLADFRNFDGSPILDATATLLTPGTIAEVWASPVLPNWMFSSVISIFCDASRKDASSTAISKLYAGIHTVSLADSLYANTILGIVSATSIDWRGLSALGNSAVCAGGVLTGTTAEKQVGDAIRRGIGSYAYGLTKARVALVPGATTNAVRVHSFVIKSGTC